MTQYHYLLDPIGALHDNEKAATVQLARMKGVSIPDVMAEALRDHLHANLSWMRDQKAKQAELSKLVTS